MNEQTEKLRKVIFQLTRSCKDNACVLCRTRVDDILQACKDEGLMFVLHRHSSEEQHITIDSEEAQQ